MSLMRANRESVGGLPEPAISERLERGTVLLAEINGDPVGYVLYDYRGGVLRIPQACIQYDARRRKYGEALMVALLARHHDADEVSLRCATDLEANVFWRDMGFTCVGTTPGGRRRGRTINSWALWLTPRLLTVDQIAVLPAAELRVDSMYDDTDYLTAAPAGFKPAVALPKLAWSNRKRKIA
ncbi:MAG: GNAT family N-acetyltransferase [Solirubrobacteraceae bacterium]